MMKHSCHCPSQVEWLRIGWSFYAGAVGAWVITSPSGFASFAGLLGLCMYSLAAGLPFLMIAYAGEKIQGKVPHVLSLTAYAGWRYGEVSKLYVALVALFNMSIALLAEYYTMGLIFKFFVGSVSYPMVIVVGVLALAYTTYGGLLVSIYTDTVQGVSSVFFFLILAIYMAATFRPGELPTPLPCEPYGPGGYAACVSGTPDCSKWDALGNGENCPISGYSSILTLPAGLFAATVFSEAMWQRAWASKDNRTRKIGAWVGCGMVVFIVFFAGFTGLLTVWAQNPSLTYLQDANGDFVLKNITFNGQANQTTSFEANPNLYLFQVLYKGIFPNITDMQFATSADGVYFPVITFPTVQNWMGVICVVLAVMMNEGAVDSIQNGIAAGATSYFAPLIKGWNLLYTRCLVVAINAVLIGIGSWLALDNVKVTVIQLFLITNLLSCCSAIPVLLGLSNRLHKYVGGGSFIFSCLFSIFCLCAFGVSYFNSNFTMEKYPDGYFIDFYGHNYTIGSFGAAMYYTWIGNDYKWQFFLVPLGVSLGSMLLCIALVVMMKEVSFIRNFLERVNLYKWIDHPVPGFTAVATHEDLYEDGHYLRFGSKRFGTLSIPPEQKSPDEDGSSGDEMGTKGSDEGKPVETTAA